MQLINTGTPQEAKDAHNDFIAYVKDNNLKCTLTFLIVAIMGIGASIAALIYLPKPLNAHIIFISLFVAAFLGHFAMESRESAEDFAAPAIYQYHKMLENYKILDVKAEFNKGDYYVTFTLENDNHEVSYKTIYGFKSTIKTDITETVVDIKNRKICTPYKQS